jgi:hypothetical protein
MGGKKENKPNSMVYDFVEMESDGVSLVVDERS